MPKTISKGQFKLQLDRNVQFLLVKTLSDTAYQHVHLPGAINPHPARVKQLAPILLPANIVVIGLQ